ncbi:unnamed protein product [Rodentolepis nana]|uniref:DUF1104 domain-containing protein n=1 Tax=Rodentolepis nana TaxID=102285 RepID=A0A0R3T0M3_RODNA|nr:unnamed protein product [Rodentolepis nana]
MFNQFINMKLFLASFAVVLLLSDFSTEAHPHSRDGDIPELSVKAAVDEKLAEAKEILDQYFDESPGDIRKRAVRLLRLGK